MSSNRQRMNLVWAFLALTLLAPPAFAETAFFSDIVTVPTAPPPGVVDWYDVAVNFDGLQVGSAAIEVVLPSRGILLFDQDLFERRASRSTQIPT